MPVSQVLIGRISSVFHNPGIHGLSFQDSTCLICPLSGNVQSGVVEVSRKSKEEGAG